MKRALIVIVLAALCATAVSAQIAMRIKNFLMVYEGNALTKPIDVTKLEKAALKTLAHYDWVVQSNEKGKITARYEKSGGRINAVIEVSVSEDGYSIAYVSSKGLDADLEGMTIHTSYIKWVKNLIKDIGIEYQ